MVGTYLDSNRSTNWLGLIVIALIILAIIGGILFFFQSRQKIVSPIPPQPAFEVIFYTPTPAAITPTSTPSATPKVKRTPTPTLKSTAKVSPTPSAKSSPAAPTVSPTKKPSLTPTPQIQ